MIEETVRRDLHPSSMHMRKRKRGGRGCVALLSVFILTNEILELNSIKFFALASVVIQHILDLFRARLGIRRTHLDFMMLPSYLFKSLVHFFWCRGA